VKHILLVLFLVSILSSCSKDPNTQSGTNASGSITYKVNGNPVSMNNVDLMTGQYVVFQKSLKGVAPVTRYILNAQNGANNVLFFTIASDSLQKTNYHYDSTAVFSTGYLLYGLNYQGQVSALLRNGDYFDINISDYSSGRITGTFTGKLTSYSTGQPAAATSITEGKINSVQVVY
jgi:hypothetical protein